MRCNSRRVVESSGFDPLMNIVLGETVEFKKDGTKNNVDMVVIQGN